ncbi:MAG: adenylate/guanylate cyclase domain-containing protein [Erysipelotrichaceae bacterium]
MANPKKRISYAFQIAVVITFVTLIFTLSDVGYYFRNLLSDNLYNQTSYDKGEIVVIGMDDYALEQLGALPWPRSIMADVIDILNMDEEYQPAAIGIDVIYAGETDSYEDGRLIETLDDYDNVVLACSANFDVGISTSDTGEVYMNNYRIYSTDMPYEAFNAKVGHVNAMYDEDGILRHHLWSIEFDGEEIYSLPYELYKLYSEYHNLEADFMPTLSADGFWYVDYSREPGDYYTYSVADIIEGNYDPEILKDRVVLIGVYEASSMDYFITSTDRSTRMYGIEYLANVTDAMIAGTDKVSYVSLSTVISLILTFISTYIFMKSKLMQALVATAIMCIGAIYGSQYLYTAGYLIEILTFLFGISLGFICSVMVNYLIERRKKQEIMSTFSRYVDNSIIDELLKEDSDSLGLEGKEFKIAVMFVDIRGFTTLSERLTPQEVVKMLNEYLTLTSSCIKNHGGTLDKFIGDATMAFWGAPLPCANPVYQACLAALEMAERVKKEINDENISFGIGIHYGTAVVGNIGSEDRMDFTAIGDTVNTGQRFESIAPKGCINVSQQVIDEVKDLLEYEALEEKMKLKGKIEPVQVYRLKGIKK